MKQGVITSVRRIERNKSGETINVIVLVLSNGTTIVRQLNQFVIDLQNSGRLLGINPDTINSVNHPAIAEESVALKNGGTVVGDYYMVKEGDEYEDTNPKSPTHGKMLKYKTSFVRVDGFLDLSPSARHAQMEMNANANARLNAQLNGLFDVFGSSSKASSTSDDDEELSPELMAEIASQTEVGSTTDEATAKKATKE